MRCGYVVFDIVGGVEIGVVGRGCCGKGENGDGEDVSVRVVGD